MARIEQEPRSPLPKMDRRSFLAFGGSIAIAGIARAAGVIGNPGVAQADGTPPTPTEVPTPVLGKKEGVAEISLLTLSSNPYYFTYGGVNHEWTYDNFDYNSMPPNNPEDRTTGTIIDKNRGNGQILNYIQADLALHPEIQRGPGVNVLIGAHLVDPQTGKFYLGEESTDRNGDIVAKFEMGDVAAPNDFSKRAVYNNGLSNRASTAGNGMFQSFALYKDDKGKYIEMTIRYVNNPSQPSDVETEQLRLNANGKPTTGQWISADRTPTRTVTRTRTLTPVPDRTPTRTVTRTRTLTPVPDRTPTRTATPRGY